MSNRDALETYDLEYFIEYNREYDNDKYRLSEARRFDIPTIEKWIEVRDEFRFVPDYVKGNWKEIRIVESCSKYGTNYIYVEPEQKLWRISQTGSEFYGHHYDKYFN